jgi:hypothetical protein
MIVKHQSATMKVSAGPRIRALCMATALALVGLAGCARTSVENVQEVPSTQLPRPDIVIVHDFGVTPADVSLDRAAGARLIDAMKTTPEQEQQLKLGREVTHVMTEHLVKQISALGIPAVAAGAATPVAGPSLDLEGQILTVDEGNRLRRVVIGFGAGATEVRSLTQVYEITNDGRRLVEDFYTTVKSSRKPGMGPMGAVGGAVEGARAAGVAAGTSVASEFSQSVDADAKHTAEQITKELKKFFVRQGWIAP